MKTNDAGQRIDNAWSECARQWPPSSFPCREAMSNHDRSLASAEFQPSSLFGLAGLSGDSWTSMAGDWPDPPGRSVVSRIDALATGTPRRDTRFWIEQLRVADDFWLICHHDRTGRPRLGAIAARHGLAAALLAELVLSNMVMVHAGYLRATGRLPRDSTALALLETIAGEPTHDLRTWIAYLSQNAADIVAERLVRAGLVQIAPARHLFKTVTVHRPVDPQGAYWRPARLEEALLGRRGRIITWSDIFLAALIEATGLFDIDIWEDPATVAATATHLLRGGAPALRELTAATHGLIGEAVLRIGR